MPYTVTFPDQYLAVAGVPLNTPAWEHTNIQAMLSGPATRGSNIVIPGAIGVRPRRKRVTETTRTVELFVTGDRDPNDTPYADPVRGLLENVDLLRAAVTDPPDTNNSVVVATLNWRGDTRSAYVQVTDFEVSDAVGTSSCFATFDLVFITGGFA